MLTGSCLCGSVAYEVDDWLDRFRAFCCRASTRWRLKLLVANENAVNRNDGAVFV